MKPIIGINLDVTNGPPLEVRLQFNYYQAVLKAGGIPVLLPPMPAEDVQAVLDRLSGVLFVGGNDYCPSRYGEEADKTVKKCHVERESFDFDLMRRALERDKMPVLGICLGAQLLNVSLGGSLFQDIKAHVPDTKVEHASKNGWEKGFNRHQVRFEEGTKLAEIYQGKKISVPTSHHQAVRDTGENLVATAWADDGIIEAVEMQGRPFVIGVQWHPERDFAGNKKLFETFIEACASNNGHSA